ncbi:MAG: CHAT domain-containing protein [Chloroflexales bacterium]|nr:CHAT domain-containing protein [Chloroflexales bacterium]
MTEPRAPIALTITFTPEGDGASLRWEADVIGARASVLAPPIPLGDLALALRALDVLQDPCYPYARTAAQARHFAFDEGERARLADLALLAEAGRVAPDAPRRLGRRLYAALTADPTAHEALATVRDHAAALGRPLSLDLAFPPGADRLAALPWELLWDNGPAPLLLSRGLAGGLTRRLDLGQALPPPRRGSGPLRILAVSPQTGIGPELRQVERAARADALGPLIARGKASLEELEPVSRAALVRAIEAAPPDIVHFYGHGRLRDGVGELLFDDPGGAGWVSAAALAAILGRVGLVTLYACQGGTVGDGPGDPLLGGVAQALVASGVPAVLGMQLAVRATAATRAAAAVYGALADGRGLH